MKKEISEHAAAAKAIRAIVKKHGAQGKVKSATYSMGSSVYVYLTNPTTEQYIAVGDEVKAYQYGHFDGMVDMYESTNCREDIPQVKYVLVEVEYTEDVLQRAWDVVLDKFGGMDDAPANVNDSYRWVHPESRQRSQELIRQAMAGVFGEFTI